MIYEKPVLARFYRAPTIHPDVRYTPIIDPGELVLVLEERDGLAKCLLQFNKHGHAGACVWYNADDLISAT